jgi:hypothetical protein
MIHHLPVKTNPDLIGNNPCNQAIIYLQYTCQASTLIGQAQMWQVFF